MSAKRDRLGKGLGALLGEYLGEQRPEEAVQARMIPVGAIMPNPFQPRREFSEQELAELTASIRENGLLQPVVVRPAPGAGGTGWELVAGERRWRAVTKLGWKEIPAVIKEVDNRTLLVLALVENLQRQQLSALEEAEGFRRLGEEFALSHQQIAEIVGRDRSTVANSLRLLQLPASVRQMLGSGQLSAGHARALLGMGSDRRMAELAREAIEHGWSVRELEARVQRSRPTPPANRKRAQQIRDVNEQLLEEALQRRFGAEVKIKAHGVKGKIEIPFSGAEDFDRVFELLAGKSPAEFVS
jgi:ParB family chromosome partitioning protein